MIHSEHLRASDESYEIRHDNSGNAIHVFIEDGWASIFPTLNDLVKRSYFGDYTVEHFQCEEKHLESIYSTDNYKYYDIKKKFLSK